MPDLDKCTVTGYARNHDGSLKAGGKIRVHSVSKTGASIEHQNNSIYESAASGADGVMTVEFPRACDAWISGPFKINGVDFSLARNPSGRRVTIPDAATANLEDLPAASQIDPTGLTVQSDGEALAGLFAVLNFSEAFEVEREGARLNVQLADNPFPDYLTQVEGDARYAALGSGVTDHGLLTGLGDDDHTQYHTNARGDARYPLLTDPRLTDSRTPTGGAGGVLSGSYPNPGFAVDMATQAELDAKAPLTAGVNAQTGTTYTLQASDNGKVVTCSNASAITVTVPSGLGAGFNVMVIQLGVGAVTFSASGTTVNHRLGYTKTAGQYAAVSLVAHTANVFVLGGDASS